jgi:hypothetical protein
MQIPSQTEYELAIARENFQQPLAREGGLMGSGADRRSSTKSVQTDDFGAPLTASDKIA